MNRLVIFLMASSAFAQQNTLLLKQERDGAAPQLLTALERSTLSDPLFNLVLSEHADVRDLRDLIRLIQPELEDRHIFVVDERIGTDSRGSRRAVIAFTGDNGGEPLDGNVMLSVAIRPDSFPREIAVEAWGWDNHRDRYNYYKLDRMGTSTRTWKFRGSSEDADLLAVNERQGTCLQCHLNGAPIMKELFRPWNNWHSLDFNARYLSGQFAQNPWPISQDPDFRPMLKQAERLEPMIIRAVRRFNNSRINRALKRTDDTGDVEVRNDRHSVMEGKRLLSPLFRPSEFNIISALQRSGFDPWGDASGPSSGISIPNSFFLNAELIAGGGPAGYNGLKIADARRFLGAATVPADTYRQLVDSLTVRFDGIDKRDAVFAWFVPEASHIDNDLADQLLRRGVVTPHFLSAVLSIDLEDPLSLSAERAELLRFIPDEFDFSPVPRGTDPLTLSPSFDQLTQLVVENIESETDRSATANELLRLLKLPDARAALEGAVAQYLQRTKDRLSSPEADVEFRRLFIRSLKLRDRVLQHAPFASLDETGGRLLFPLPLSIPEE